MFSSLMQSPAFTGRKGVQLRHFQQSDVAKPNKHIQESVDFLMPCMSFICPYRDTFQDALQGCEFDTQIAAQKPSCTPSPNALLVVGHFEIIKTLNKKRSSRFSGKYQAATLGGTVAKPL